MTSTPYCHLKKFIRFGGLMKYIDWLIQWLENYVRPSVKVRTYERYRLIIEQHIKDKIGGIELNEDNLSNSLSGYFSLSSETIIAFCFFLALPQELRHSVFLNIRSPFLAVDFQRLNLLQHIYPKVSFSVCLCFSFLGVRP